MTGLSFKSSEDSNNNIIQKYPIVWWTNLIILAILSQTVWTYYVRRENMDAWFVVWCHNSPQFAMGLGFGIISIVFIVMMIVLGRLTWKKGE